MNQHRTLTLPDGRSLGFADFGHPTGVPLFYFHGTMSSRLEARLLDLAARDVGVRLIAVDRPGMGLSTWHEARSLRSWADDVSHLANHLRLERFGVAGWSGGGAYAAAVASVLGDRVTRLTLIAPQAPREAIRTISGRPLLIQLFEGLTQWTTLHLLITAWIIGRVLAWRGSALFRALPHALFCQADRRLLASAAFSAALADAWGEGLICGTRGAAHDVALLLRPWDFVPGGMTCPVDIICGADDKLCPPSYARWFSTQCAGASLTIVPEAGHLHIADAAAFIVAPHALATVARARAVR